MAEHLEVLDERRLRFVPTQEKTSAPKKGDLMCENIHVLRRQGRKNLRVPALPIRLAELNTKCLSQPSSKVISREWNIVNPLLMKFKSTVWLQGEKTKTCIPGNFRIHTHIGNPQSFYDPARPSYMTFSFSG